CATPPRTGCGARSLLVGRNEAHHGYRTRRDVVRVRSQWVIAHARPRDRLIAIVLRAGRAGFADDIAGHGMRVLRGIAQVHKQPERATADHVVGLRQSPVLAVYRIAIATDGDRADIDERAKALRAHRDRMYEGHAVHGPPLPLRRIG